MSDMEAKLSLVACSWRRRWCELVAAGTVCKDSKVCFMIYHNSQGSVCNDIVSSHGNGFRIAPPPLKTGRGSYILDVVCDDVDMFSPLAPIKISGSIGPPGVMRAQFRLIIKYVVGLRRSTRARRIARIKYTNKAYTGFANETSGIKTHVQLWF